MKKTLLFFCSLIILSCSPDNSDNDINNELPSTQEPENPENPETPETPETPTDLKLPQEINFRFNDLDINRDYTSQNLYTYDELNRITEIEINSKVNGIDFEKHNYRIVYNLDTNLAKGFEVIKYSYQDGTTSTKYLKLKYPESNGNSSSNNFTYYNYVSSYSEINDNNFDVSEDRKISMLSNFIPYNCGPNLLPGVSGSNVIGNGTNYFGHLYYGFDTYIPQQDQFFTNEIQSMDPGNLTPYKGLFVNAKFDYIFWIFFLEYQFFQNEIMEDISRFVYINTKLNYYDGSYGLQFKNEEESNIYLNNTYPVYKKYTARQFFSNDPNRQINYFEYHVTYN